MNVPRQSSPFVWHFDRRDNVWKYGTDKDGMGVFQEPDGSWHGNVVTPHYNDITGLGPFNTVQEAINESEIWYLRLKARPV